MKKQILIIATTVLLGINCFSQSRTSGTEIKYEIIKDISYKSDQVQDNYESERCKLDLYIPKAKPDYPVLVWFHGGSLTRCSKDDDFTKALGIKFASEGIGVAIVNYRLSPIAKYPAYIDDAAASVAWVYKNISGYKGNNKKIFIGGHSAGGYLVYMLIMDPSYIEKYDIKSNNIAGVIPVAGQTFTHYTIREEIGIKNPQETPIINEAAPCYHAKKNTPPILVVCADGDSKDRIEENKYFIALLEEIGNKKIIYKEIKDRTHWSMIMKIPNENDPLAKEIINFINK